MRRRHRGIHNDCGTVAGMLADLPCPACEEILGKVGDIRLQSDVPDRYGPGSQRKGYLRPETAQGMFTDFQRLLRFYRDKLPFGAVQIGKSYRNEISPRQGMIRLREFTQAEAEIFVHPEEKNHPKFKRYAEYEVPLFGIRQQQESSDPKVMTMKDAVTIGDNCKRICRILRGINPPDDDQDRRKARQATVQAAPAGRTGTLCRGLLGC